jgi:hypothetical protein
MLAAAVYRPDEWHDFFIVVGGAAAVLMGLVFVALSINLEPVVRDATHRYRAIGTLANFAGLFVLCAVALMGGQGNVAIGIEWLVVSSGACAVYVYGYLRARTVGGSRTTLSLLRTGTGTTLYLALIAGSIVLLFDASAGLYIAAIAMVILSVYSVSGAWLLLVGAHELTNDEGTS